MFCFVFPVHPRSLATVRWAKLLLVGLGFVAVAVTFVTVVPMVL
jgi:hypothetical protein